MTSSLDTLELDVHRNWADIEVEYNPYENDDNAFVPESSKLRSSTSSTPTISSSSSSSTPKKKKSKKAKSKAKDSQSTAPATPSKTATTLSTSNSTTTTPSKKKQLASPAKASSQGSDLGLQTPTKSPAKTVDQSPSSSSKSATKTPSKKSLKKREVVFKEITVFDSDLSGEQVEQQRQEILQFFAMFGAIESTDARWSDRSCSVVYQTAADAANVIKEFKSVSKLEDYLSALAEKKQDLFINLKNVWNIKATLHEDNKPQPPKPSKAHPPSYQPPQPRHHLFSHHPRSPKGEWRPVGVARSQQQQPQQQPQQHS